MGSVPRRRRARQFCCPASCLSCGAHCGVLMLGPHPQGQRACQQPSRRQCGGFSSKLLMWGVVKPRLPRVRKLQRWLVKRSRLKSSPCGSKSGCWNFNWRGSGSRVAHKAIGRQGLHLQYPVRLLTQQEGLLLQHRGSKLNRHLLRSLLGW